MPVAAPDTAAFPALVRCITTAPAALALAPEPDLTTATPSRPA
jgi:hypothetical protein